MDLISFIKAHGDEPAADALGVSVRTIASYRRYERTPTVRQIIHFSKVTDGAVDVAETAIAYRQWLENEPMESTG